MITMKFYAMCTVTIKKLKKKFKKIHTHTNPFSHTNAILLNIVKQKSQKEKQFCLPCNSIMYSQNMLSWIQSSHVSISLRISPHNVSIDYPFFKQ